VILHEGSQESTSSFYFLVLTTVCLFSSMLWFVKTDGRLLAEVFQKPFTLTAITAAHD